MTGAERVGFDLRAVPFSTRGSWLDLSPVTGLHRTQPDVHLVSHQTAMHPVLRLAVEGVGAADVVADAATLTWPAAAGQVEAVFASVDTVRLRGRGVAMELAVADDELTPFTGGYLFRDPVDGAHVLTVYETGRRYRLTALSGDVSARGSGALGRADRAVVARPGPDGTWELAVEEVDTGRAPYRPAESFDDAVASSSEGFAAYLEAVAPWRDATTPAAALAAYVMWSATVAPGGFVTRESVLMSKHWMDAVWSWDHRFNALALAPGLPRQAWDQLLLPFDHQDAVGALPDSVSHSRVLRNFVKPPVHGWALQRLLAADPGVDDALLTTVYNAVARWTGFWTGTRTVPGHRLPHYQHGNDSGWDNATAFDATPLVETADLAALTVVQQRALAQVARRLGRDVDAERWAAAADALQAALLDELWDGACFVARSAEDGTPHASRSLLACLPVVLGADLPADVTAALADDVRAHLTEHGLATEPVDAPAYEPDGYWRGPVWAPSTLLVEDGLRRAGQVELADEISLRFRRLCERSGFAENFDALTGEGLRDRAYTWTASTYLVLAAASRR